MPPTLTRGPYLQSPSATAVTVVFKTSSAAATTVRYGPHSGIAWESSKASPSGTTHVVELSGLRPDTQYFYQVESGGSVIAGGEECFFRTSPAENARTPFRFLAWGDSGTGSSTQYDVARRMEQIMPQPDFALGLGDLVYEAGEWENYDPHLFRPYAKVFARMTFWPTIGNHDYKTQSGAPYFDAFYLPTRSGAPSHPSGTEKYYSFDQGMAHFVCADSESSSNDPGSAMYTWISDDLDDARARGKRWLFVFMHHPPYSKGTHDSGSESELITLRQNLVPLFEAKGVDMVMVGHSHVYERSYLARNGQVLQNNPGDYTKIGTPNGTIYLVSGCGGASGSGSLNHPLMAVSKGYVAGFNLVDVSWEDVRGSFVEKDGRTTDLFRLHKSADTQPPRVVSVRAPGANEIRVVFDEPVRSGSGASSAENPGNYQMSTATVHGAALGSDKRTVTLTTTNLLPSRGYLMHVLGVADLGGNVSSVQPTSFVLEGEPASGGGGTSGPPLVARGTTWRYLKGTSAPPSNWASRTFIDSGWGQARAAFGYGYGGEATPLADMKDRYATVYFRQSFNVADPSLISRLQLGAAFDDGFVAYLNGTEIVRGNMPSGPLTHTTLASSSHERAGFEPLDVTAAGAALVAGQNVLAIEAHNFTLGSPDFWLDLELVPTLSSGSGSGGGGTSGPPLVARGTTWRYLKGTSAPPAGWGSRTFVDSGWSQGRAVFGYGYGSEGTLLADMKDRYATVYFRQAFNVADPSLISRLQLGAAFDDGFVAYLNGTEIVRGNMPPGTLTHTTLASSSHEQSGFEPFDVSASRGVLVPGQNVLAIEAHNFTLGSPDFWLDLELVPTLSSGGGGGGGGGGGAGNPPIAVIDGPVQTANSPARIDFSAALSRDPDGGPLAYLWDFGDGTRGAGPRVQHTYAVDGTYVVTLGVRDRQLLDAIDQRTLYIQSLGLAPLVQLRASQTQVSRGTRIDFNSAGSVDPDGGSLYAYWDFGDVLSGEANHSTASGASHVFAAAGVFVVRLAITDDEGSTATQTVAITVQ